MSLADRFAFLECDLPFDVDAFAGEPGWKLYTEDQLPHFGRLRNHIAILCPHCEHEVVDSADESTGQTILMCFECRVLWPSTVKSYSNLCTRSLCVRHITRCKAAPRPEASVPAAVGVSKQLDFLSMVKEIA